MNKINIIYDACVPAWKTAALAAQKNGVPYGIHITTTPNNIDTEPGKFAKRITLEACRFAYNLYDIESEEELHQYVDDNSSNNFVFIEYTWKELGRTEEWYSSMRKQMSDRVKVKRELDLEWPKSSDNSVFTEDEIDALSAAVKPLQYSIAIDIEKKKYQIDFYERPDFSKKYILSCDVSGGTAKDNSVITVIDPQTFHAIGDFKNSKIDTDAFKKLIEAAMTMYFPYGILVIERNSYGKNILDQLMKNPKIEPRMYREYRDRVAERVTENGNSVKQKRKTIVYGVDTTNKSRKAMFDLLDGIVKEEPEICASPRLYEDIKNLIMLPNQRIEADKDFHDDNVMSYLIARYAIFYGTYLQNKFGIKKFASSENGVHGSDGESAMRLMSQIEVIERKANLPSDNLVGQLINEQQHDKKRIREEQNSNRPQNIFDKIAKWNSNF